MSSPRTTDSVLGAKLDETLYRLEGENLAFLQAQTGITDEAALKQHVLRIQAEAYKVYPYTCIQIFSFLHLNISRLPAYQQVLRLGKERKDSIFLDIGCCFGNDIRKAIADGYPLENVIASDLHPEFWDFGHMLFKTTRETFPVPFLPGDAFDSSFIELAEPRYTPVDTLPPDLRSLTDLRPLNGHISAIHVSAVFHLFDEAQQLDLARRLAGLLSPLPGSVILGAHRGTPEKGTVISRTGRTVFDHSVDSWKELWDGIVFRKGSVKVDAELRELTGDIARGVLAADPTRNRHWLIWSVTRL